jgi:hypothetical protein
VKWATANKSSVHDNGGAHSLQLGNMACVVYHIDAHKCCIVDESCLKLVAIYVPGQLVDEQHKRDMKGASEYIQLTSPCKEKGIDRRGANKRGPICMTSVGFNFAANNLGKVSTYKRKSCPPKVNVELWGQTLRFLGVVRSVLSTKMGIFPLRALASRCHLKEGESPTIMDICTSIHQTLNAEVWPHVDTGDYDYTVIAWSQSGDVRGPFLLHALGVAFDVQVGVSNLIYASFILYHPCNSHTLFYMMEVCYF